MTEENNKEDLVEELEIDELETEELDASKGGGIIRDWLFGMKDKKAPKCKIERTSNTCSKNGQAQ